MFFKYAGCQVSVGRCAGEACSAAEEGVNAGGEKSEADLALGGTRECELEERGYMRARLRRDERKARSTAWKTRAVRQSEGGTPRPCVKRDRKCIPEVSTPEDTQVNIHKDAHSSLRDANPHPFVLSPGKRCPGPFRFWILLLTSLQTSLLRLP